MKTFIILNLHLLTDSKLQLNISKVKSNNTVRSYQRRRRVGGKAMVECIEFFFEGGNISCTAYIFRKDMPNLRCTRGKTMAKVFN